MEYFYINPDAVKKYIQLEECKDNFLYAICARNSCLGIFKKAEKSFTISRFKFAHNFLFDEFHWDTENYFGSLKLLGTVKPLAELNNVEDMDDEKKLKFLNDKFEELKDKIKPLFSKEENML